MKLGAIDFAGGTVVHLSTGRLGARRRARARQAQGLPVRAPPSAQPDDDGARRRHPVVRLVRLQRRQRARCQRPRRARARQHAHRRGRGRDSRGPSSRARGSRRPRCSASRRVSSPASSRSRRPPASCRRWRAIAIGALAGGVCYGGVLLKSRLGYDDALDAFGVHGVGGATGALLTGVFATRRYNNGHGGGFDSLLGKQAIAIGAAGAWAAVVTFVLLKVIDLDDRPPRRPRDRARRSRRRAPRRVRRMAIRRSDGAHAIARAIIAIWQIVRQNRLNGSAISG